MSLKCCDISLRSFMAAMFNQQYEGVGGVDNWEFVYTEYIDLSGIGETQEYNLLQAIQNKQQRIAVVQGYIDLQRKWFDVYKQPFDQAFPDLRKYGHRLTWDEANPEQFLKQLDACELREKTQIAELDSLMKELDDLRLNGPKVTPDSRKEFVIQKNRLGKAGFQIDLDKTNMEEYALMIKDYADDVAQQNAELEKAKNKS